MSYNVVANGNVRVNNHMENHVWCYVCRQDADRCCCRHPQNMKMAWYEYTVDGGKTWTNKLVIYAPNNMDPFFWGETLLKQWGLDIHPKQIMEEKDFEENTYYVFEWPTDKD